MTRAADEIRPATAVRLIAGRELNMNLRKRSFIVGTLVILAVMAGYLLLQATVLSDADTQKVGLSGQAAGVAEPLKTSAQQLGETVEISTVDNLDEARKKVADGDLDAVVSGSPGDLQILVKSEVDKQLQASLTAITQQQALNAELARAGQNPAAVLTAVNAKQPAVTTIEQPDPQRGQRIAAAMVMMVLLYISLISYGMLVATGTVEEKASRVVEILLSTVRPWHLLLGKVIGLGLVGLAQLAILAGAGLVMATASGVFTVGGIGAGTVLWGLLWYLLGFFLYATVYAGAGALVSRQEDAQSVLTPVTMVLMIGFILGITLLPNPDGDATMILSLIPVISPILMPGRIITGAAAGWEIALAIALTLLTIALFTWLGGKIYQNAVLRTGSRVRLTEALRG